MTGDRALRGVAVERDHRRELLPGVDALGHHGDAERPDHPRDAADRLRRLDVGAELGEKAPIELDACRVEGSWSCGTVS